LPKALVTLAERNYITEALLRIETCLEEENLSTAELAFTT
jgi:hypothetical protein